MKIHWPNDFECKGIGVIQEPDNLDRIMTRLRDLSQSIILEINDYDYTNYKNFKDKLFEVSNLTDDDFNEGDSFDPSDVFQLNFVLLETYLEDTYESL